MQFNDRFFDELATSEGVTNLVRSVAEDGASIARSTAPVNEGDYRDGISVKMKKQKRSVALIVSTDWKTFLIESKTGNLSRALRALSRKSRR